MTTSTSASAPASAAVAQLDTNNQQTTQHPASENHPQSRFSAPDGLVLRVDFSWTKFRNIISEDNGQSLTTRYVQHFRSTKPQLRFSSADNGKQMGEGSFHQISISGECMVNGRAIELRPLKRWKTRYNFLSLAFASPSAPKTLVPLTWTAVSGFKTWNFICLDKNQLPIAQFAANWWAMKAVGKFQFERSRETLSDAQRDEVVITGLTLMYMMMSRINNPLTLVGAAFAKPGRVEEGMLK
jgi:hypothetical protein